MNLRYHFFLTVILPVYLFSQIGTDIHLDRRAEWQYAGYPGSTPIPQTSLNILDFYTSDYAQAINDAIQAADENIFTEIFIPEGTYYLDDQISINKKNILLRGEGPNKTRLAFINQDGRMIVVNNYNNQKDDNYESSLWTNISSGLYKNSNELIVDDVSSFSIPCYAELRQPNGGWFYGNDFYTGGSPDQGSNWTNNAVGQIVKIISIDENENKLIIDDSDRLRIDYTFTGANTKIRYINPISNVGIEDLYIQKSHADSDPDVISSNIYFLYSAKCWVRGVESELTNNYHIDISRSTEIEVSGCYIHKSHNYNGGHGYGVTIQYYSGKCTIENNIFKKLRHAMLLQLGANGNVFGYNYSREPHGIWNDIEFKPGDAVLHGNYPFSNLFEGNVCDWIKIDEEHGFNGLYNTFVRNNVIDGTITVEESYIQYYNFYKNNGFVEYHATLGSYGTYNVIWYLEGSENDYSYYENSKPEFFDNLNWPFDAHGTSIPAKLRYDAGTYTYNSRKYIDLYNANENYTQLGGTLTITDLNNNNPINSVTISSNQFKIPLINETYVDVQTNQDILGSRKHIYWDNYPENYMLVLNNYESGIDQNSIRASFKPQNTIHIDEFVHNSIKIRDPWFVSNPSTLTQPNEFNQIPTDGYYEVFLNQNINFLPDLPVYGISSNEEVSKLHYGEQVLYYFSKWYANPSNAIFRNENQYQTDVVFKNSSADVTALYKGHLATSQPDNADSKNQRRLVEDGNDWLMVYEDAGDIWCTFSNDQGVSWADEVQLNIRQGFASNPSISNIINNYYYIVTWLEENASGDTEVHLQTMRLPLAFGWTGSPYNTEQIDGVNHRIFNQTANGEAEEDARPVLWLEWSNDDLLLTLASECDGTGIRLSKILFEEDGPYPSVVDLEDAEALADGIGYPHLSVAPNNLGFTRVVSTSQYDNHPNIVSVPPSYGASTKRYIYYAYSAGYNSKIYQYDISTMSSSSTTLPSEFSGISSLQCAAWPQNATIALSVRTSAYIGGPNVVVYERPSYGGMPQIKDVYRGYDHPTIMIEQYGGFNSSGADHLLMLQNTSGTWYKSDGSSLTSIGSDVSGIFMRTSFPSGDNKVMYTKTYPELPALIKKYSGSGQLLKNTYSGADIVAIRYWQNKESIVKRTVLDFKSVQAEVVDSLESDYVLAAVKILKTGDGGLIVSQPDTNITPLAVEVMRDDKCISSYRSTSWQKLTKKSLPEFKKGDVLLFKLDEDFKRLWSFKELHYNAAALSKESIDPSFESLIPIVENIDIYPNPFNPVTNFKISLSELAHVNLKIYNSLGQLVGSLINRDVEAGVTVVQFNASHLSSGLYFYRLAINNRLKTGKLLLMK